MAISTTFKQFVAYAKMAYEYNSNRVIVKTIIDKEAGVYQYSNRDLIECSIFGTEKFKKRYDQDCPVLILTDAAEKYADSVDDILTHHRFIDICGEDKNASNMGKITLHAPHAIGIGFNGYYNSLRNNEEKKRDRFLNSRGRRKVKKFKFIDIVNHSQQIGHVSKQRFGIMSWVVKYADYLEHLHDRQLGSAWKLYKNTSNAIKRSHPIDKSKLQKNGKPQSGLYSEWSISEIEYMNVTIFKRYSKRIIYSTDSSVCKRMGKLLTKYNRISMKHRRNNSVKAGEVQYVEASIPPSGQARTKKTKNNVATTSKQQTTDDKIYSAFRKKYRKLDKFRRSLPRSDGSKYAYNFYSGYTDNGDLVTFRSRKWLDFKRYEIKCKIQNSKKISTIFDGSWMTTLSNVKIIENHG